MVPSMRSMSLVVAVCCHGNFFSWCDFFFLNIYKICVFMLGNRPNTKTEWTVQTLFLGLFRRKGQTKDVTCSKAVISFYLCIVCAVIVNFSHIMTIGRNVTLGEILFSCRYFFSTLHGTVAFGSRMMEWSL